MHADLAVGPVKHGPPQQPLAIFQAAENLFDLLLAGVGGGDVARRPVLTSGQQERAAEPVTDQMLVRHGVEVELRAPTTLDQFQFVADQVGQKGGR